MFNCSECGTSVALPLSSSIKTVTCRRCGEVYFVNDSGDPPRRYYPALQMHPFNAATQGAELTHAISKWMPGHTRPLRPGTYECRFRPTGDAILRLDWDGLRFVAGGKRVVMTDFLTWRGVLA